MATGTQLVLEVKRINWIIVPSGLHEDKKLDRSLKTAVFLCIYYLWGLIYLDISNGYFQIQQTI